MAAINNDFTADINKILAMGLMVLRENCVMPRVVNSSYGTDAAQKGDVISIPIASEVTVTDVVPGHLQTESAPISFSGAQVAINQWKKADFALTDKQLSEVRQLPRQQQVDEAARAIANDINKYILNLYKKIPYYTGDPAVIPFSDGTTKDVTSVLTILNKNLAPRENRSIVLSPAAQGEALNLQQLQDISWGGYADVIRDGVIRDRRFGFDWYMDQHIPTHTAGSLVAGVVGVGGADVGDTSIPLVDATNPIALKAGDILVIDGTTHTYAVAADTSALATVTVAVPVTTPVKEAITAAAEVTILATHVVNFGLHRDCIAFVNRPISDLGMGGSTIQTMTDPVSGLSMRVEVTRQHKQTQFCFDVLYGAAVVRPELGCRLVGA